MTANEKLKRFLWAVFLFGLIRHTSRLVNKSPNQAGGIEMNRPTGVRPINLQLFAEETIPAKQEEANLDNKPEVKKEPAKGDPFRRLIDKFSGKVPETKEPEKKEPEKKEASKPDEKPEEKKVDAVKEPEKKEPEKEPEFDEILYNKEKVKIPVTERQTYLQKGYNYDKVKTEADTAKATLKRIAQAEGFGTVDEYLAEIGKREKAKLADQIEEAAGDPDKIDEIVKNHPIVRETKEERQKLEDDKAAMKQTEIIKELKKDKFFSDLEPQFNEIVEANPTVSPDLLYKIVRSDYLTPDKISEIIAKEKASAVQATIADTHDKERRAAPKGGDAGDGKEAVTPTSTMSEIAKALGVNANKVAQRIADKQKARR